MKRIELNQIEVETLQRILSAAKVSFIDAPYSRDLEMFMTQGNFNCFLETKTHIKSIEKIISKLRNN